MNKHENKKNHLPLVLATDSKGYSLPLNVSFTFNFGFSESMNGIIGKIKRI